MAQCNQIGRLLKGFGNKFSFNNSQNILRLLGYFEKNFLLSKHCCGNFLATFGEKLGFFLFQYLVTLTEAKQTSRGNFQKYHHRAVFGWWPGRAFSAFNGVNAYWHYLHFFNSFVSDFLSLFLSLSHSLSLFLSLSHSLLLSRMHIHLLEHLKMCTLSHTLYPLSLSISLCLSLYVCLCLSQPSKSFTRSLLSFPHLCLNVTLTFLHTFSLSLSSPFLLLSRDIVSLFLKSLCRALSLLS